MQLLGHPVEVWGWDEAYVGADVTDPLQLAEQIREVIAADTGLSCSVGIATSDVERSDDLSAEVVLAQLRSVVADLLLLTGMTSFEATDAIPPVRH